MDFLVTFGAWVLGTAAIIVVLYVAGHVTGWWPKTVAALVGLVVAVLLVWMVVYVPPEDAKDLGGMARNGSLLIVKLTATVAALLTALGLAKVLPPP